MKGFNTSLKTFRAPDESLREQFPSERLKASLVKRVGLSNCYSFSLGQQEVEYTPFCVEL